MNVRYRISVAPLDAEPFIVEHFEALSDADTYWNALMKDSDDSILYAVPYRSVVATLEEFHEGTWVLIRRTLMRKD